MNSIVTTTTAMPRLRTSVSASPRIAMRHAHAVAPIPAVSQDKCTLGLAFAGNAVVTDNAKGADALTRLVSSLEEVPV